MPPRPTAATADPPHPLRPNACMLLTGAVAAQAASPGVDERVDQVVQGEEGQRQGDPPEVVHGEKATWVAEDLDSLTSGAREEFSQAHEFQGLVGAAEE